MAENTKIEWTATHLPDGTILQGYTFNAWTGCTKVSPACDHCYAEGWAKRSGLVKWGPHSPRRRTTPSYWGNPLKWDRVAKAAGIRRKVFCASLADVGDNHKSIPQEWRDELRELISATPNLIWLFLTKRPQNIARFYPQWMERWPDNVWIGTTVENQEEAERRIPHLLEIPAKIRFLSCEPLLGPVDLMAIKRPSPLGSFSALRCEPGGEYIDWVICGGESGHGARPMDLEWARDLADQCASTGTSFFMKQMGGVRKPFPPIPSDLMIRQFPGGSG